MGGYSNFGIRRTLDGIGRFAGKAFPAYLRIQATSENTVDQNATFAQFGFQVSASGQTVATDVLITPPPLVTEVSMRDIGLNSAQLQFGAKNFKISHTFVAAQQVANNYLEPGTGLPDFYRVFRDSTVIGVWYNSRIGKIVSVTHEDIGQLPWTWNLIVNFQEQPVNP